jgi:hypothetical protein
MGLEDPAYQFRDWSPAALKRLSASGLIAAVPYPQIPVANAQRGDWLAFDGCDGPALAVCLGADALGFSPTTKCMVRIATLKALIAFKVD